MANIDIEYIGYIGINVPALVLGLPVNGDQYGVGQRYFVRPTIPLTNYMSLTGYYNHIYGSDASAKANSIDIWNAQSLTAGLVFDAKKLLFHPQVQ